MIVRAMGIRGAAKSAFHSLNECNRPDRLILGSNVVTDIGSNATLDLDSRFLMGVVRSGASDPRIDDSKLSVRDSGTLRTTSDGFGRIGPGSTVHVEGEFEIGDSYVNGHAQILAEEEITIGSGCALAWNVTLLDSDRHQLIVDHNPVVQTAPISIGDNVWIGHDVIIKKGVSVADGAVIASGSIITEDVPERTLVAGTPAEPQRSPVSWDY